MLPGLRKIWRQLQGSENIFGYNSTVANQIYLFYCFIGKIYFTDKIHKSVKYFWYVSNLYVILIAYSVGFAYLWFDPKNDLLMMMNVVNFVGLCNAAVFGFPLISYLFGDSIEEMIKRVDHIFTTSKDVEQQQKVINRAKKVSLLTNFLIFLFDTMYVVVCFFDVLLFFEEKKVKNHLYYGLPLPMIDTYGSFELFCFANLVVSAFVMAMVVLVASSLSALVLYWDTVYRNESITLCNDFHTGMCNLKEHIDDTKKPMESWDRAFAGIVTRGVRRFQNIVSLIDNLRGFVEVIGSFTTITCFFYSIIVLFFCASDGLQLVVKIKYLMIYMATAVMVFMFYWVGQNLNNTITNVSLAVYFTPWYRSVKIRNDVYIFLCQIQSLKNFAIVRVYGLLYRNFSRYLHAAMSCTNILRKLTQQQ